MSADSEVIGEVINTIIAERLGDDLVHCRFVPVANRDVHQLIFYSSNYVERQISGLQLQSMQSKYATINAIEAWVNSDLTALASQLEYVASEIREVVRSGG